MKVNGTQPVNTWQQGDLSSIYTSLRQQDIVLTQKRQVIIQFIYENGVLEDIEQSWVELRQQANISWATMYCTVRLLVRLGWLEVDKTDRKRKYIIQKTN